MSRSYPRAIACGDSAVNIVFGDAISSEINARVLALDEAIAAEAPVGVIETVPTYSSLLIHYDPVATTHASVSGLALTLASSSRALPAGRLLRVPVCYEGEFGTDLKDVAARLGMTVSEVVERHTAPTYRVYMLGFQPGFAYLGGLDERLRLPRRDTIRRNAPAGTVSIAALQSAVHAVEGPSGWHWLGRTPARTYIPGASSEFAFRAGDSVRFVSVSARRWSELHALASRGQSIIEEANSCPS